MTTNHRTAILSRIRAALANPELASERGAQPSAPAAAAGQRGEPASFDPRSLVTRWRAELEALTGQVYGPMAPEGVAAQVSAIAQRYQANEILAWDARSIAAATAKPGQQPGAGSGYLPVLQALPQQLRESASIHLTAPDLTNQNQRMERERLARLPLGLTGAMAGLADTGSIVVLSGPGRARSASLLPPVHLALLHVNDLYPDLTTWMTRQGATMLGATANLTIITGPSRTADIEMNLVIGVHGPGEIHVILIE
jgi:L-lactate dehydrogenase complex protein LldG